MPKDIGQIQVESIKARLTAVYNEAQQLYYECRSICSWTVSDRQISRLMQSHNWLNRGLTEPSGAMPNVTVDNVHRSATIVLPTAE